MSRTYDPSGWNQLHGIVSILQDKPSRISEKTSDISYLSFIYLLRQKLRLPDKARTWFEIERAQDNKDFIVDNLSFTKMTCDPDELVLNGDLETGNSKYWDTWGGRVALETVEPGYGGQGSALMSSNRAGSTWHNFAQILNLDCVNNGQSLNYFPPGHSFISLVI